VCVFDAGSRYRIDGPVTPAMSGRTYADFEYNNGGTQSPSGGNALQLDSLVVTQGTLNLAMTGGTTIRGDIHVKPGATLNFNPTLAAQFSMAGTATQSIDAQGTFATTANATLDVNNVAGVALVTNVTLVGGLSFTNGRLNTGARTLIQTSTSNTVGASQGTGWVNGTLAKTYSSGTVNATLDVGDAATYAPIGISATGAPAGYTLTASTSGGDHPNLGTSGIDPARSVNRRWTLSPATATGAIWSATFNYASSDVDGTADPSTFIAQVYNGSAWADLTEGTRTANTTQVTGLTTGTPGTQFAVGNAVGVPHTLTVNVVGGGTVAKSPNTPTYPDGSKVQLTGTPGTGWAFSAWSGGLVSALNPDSVLMNADKTVTATFVDVAAPTITVTAPNGGELLTTGNSTNLTWTAADNAGVTAVDLELSRTGSGGTYETIATGLANSGTFSWSPTFPVTAHAILRARAHDAAGHTTQDLSNAEFSIANSAGVDDGPVTEFALAAVWPNPVHRSTRFQFALPRDADIHLSLHDVQGRELSVLADGAFPAGRHSVDWSSSAARLDPGLYFVRFAVPGGKTIVRRFVLMK
jgi:hypothetical protein